MSLSEVGRGAVNSVKGHAFVSSTRPSIVTFELDHDAALVLFELLSGRENELITAMRLEAPERNALWVLEAALEKALPDLFSPNYKSLLQKARESLREKGGE